MRNNWKLLLIALALVLGWYLAQLNVRSKGREVQEDNSPIQTIKTPPMTAPSQLEELSQRFPRDAMPREYLVHFPDAASYRAYLEALNAAGYSSLANLSALRVLKISPEVLRAVNPMPYGGEVEFNFRVRQPIPPVEIDPAVLGSLKAFGASAMDISGEGLAGKGKGVLVAVLDSGVADHNVFEDVSSESFDMVLRDRTQAEAWAHGTGVASIITGRTGIAPEATLLDFRVLDGDGQGSAFMVAEAIVRAVDMGAALINMSLGLYRETTLLREAVRYADEQGVLMVAAAGNDGLPRLTYPAAYSAVLSVTAVDGSGRQAVFPNRSESIDFAAPGVGVVVADPEGGYRQISGTSAAAPFVSGTLAALLSTDLTQSPEAAVRLLEKHLNEAGALGSDEKYGGGLLDWDRLRERNTQDFQDVALAAIHMDLDSQPGTRVPINVVVQNRGTAWLPEVELAVVQLGEATEHFTITSLAPGAVAERTVYRLLPSKGFENAIELGARAGLKDANQDQRPENNAHLARFQSTEVE